MSGLDIPVVALVGRPNVGKSALFNRIVGRNAAIVSDEAGTTRDRHFARADWAGRDFWLVDTGGVVEDPNQPMDVEIRRQVDLAIAEADVLLFVVDALGGLNPTDAHIAEMLRTSEKRWLLVANKVDKPQSTEYFEFYNLGAGDPLPVSAVNGHGSGDLLDALVAALPAGTATEEEQLAVAVIGRPNVGKSSIVNRLLGEERLVVSEVAGTTRDAIDTPMRYHDRTFVFIDTAGLRRQSRVEDGIEFYSALRTRRAIERSDIAILVVDATEGQMHAQDLKVAQLGWEQGRGLIVEGRQVRREIREGGRGEGTLSQVRPLRVHVGDHGTARLEDPRDPASGRAGASQARVDVRGQRDAPGATRPTPASTGGRARGQTELCDTSRGRASNLCGFRQ
jgi:GTPase